MSVYQFVDPTADQAEDLFWSLVSVVAEQAGVTEGDAFMLMRRAWSDRIKALKPHHAVDHQGDGRSALWRVRMTIWTGPGMDSLVADTDHPKPLDQDGATVLCGLAQVGAWVRELAELAHPGRALEGLSAATLESKIKSLRVSLSNQGGACVWRLRYTVSPPAEPQPLQLVTGSLRGVAERSAGYFPHHMAHVRIAREEAAPRAGKR